MQVVHFAKPKNLEPNAFKKSPEIRQYGNPGLLCVNYRNTNMRGYCC